MVYPSRHKSGGALQNQGVVFGGFADFQKSAAFCGAGGIPLSLVRVDSLERAKVLPCPFNNFAVFYRGEFQTVNLLDEAGIRRLLKK